MKRKNISITENQNKQLQGLSKESGLSESEIIRRALDHYFQSKQENT